MKIIFDPMLMLKMMTYAHAYPREFSGFGFVNQEGNDLKVYDFVLLDVGSEVFTEIPAEKIVELTNRQDADKMKLWVHRHPMGSGIPGPENWSQTDETTIQKTPLGGIPELVRWSASAVLTPRGWVGRIDNYAKKKTAHIEVSPIFSQCYSEVDAIFKTKPVVQPTFAFRSPYKEDDDFETVPDFSQVEELGKKLIRRLDLKESDLEEFGIDMVDLVDMYFDENEDIDKLREDIEQLREEEPTHASLLDNFQSWFGFARRQ